MPPETGAGASNNRRRDGSSRYGPAGSSPDAAVLSSIAAADGCAAAYAQ
jgi:hypothetical protein